MLNLAGAAELPTEEHSGDVCEEIPTVEIGVLADS